MLFPPAQYTDSEAVFHLPLHAQPEQSVLNLGVQSSEDRSHRNPRIEIEEGLTADAWAIPAGTRPSTAPAGVGMRVGPD